MHECKYPGYCFEIAALAIKQSNKPYWHCANFNDKINADVRNRVLDS